MSLVSVPFNEIEESHLQQLVENGVPESLELEFKREIYGTENDERAEFLRDVTAFANAAGGHLVIGMAEEGSGASELVGFQETDPDSLLLRYEGQLRDGVEPRVVGIDMKSVALANGNVAVVIRIPKSWNPPHRANYRKSKKFYIRNSSGVHEVSVEELRRIFTSSAELTDRVVQFQENRLGKLITGQTPFPIFPSAIAALHIVPLSHFGKASVFTIRQAHELRDNFYTLSNSQGRCEVNLDGPLFVSNMGRPDFERNEYVQLFRDGALESVSCNNLREYKGLMAFPWQAFIRNLIATLPKNLRGLSMLGHEPPYAVSLSLVKFRGSFISTGHYGDGETFDDRDEIVTPLVVLDNAELEGDWHHLIRPILDVVFNAHGFVEALGFDDNGQWNPR